MVEYVVATRNKNGSTKSSLEDSFFVHSIMNQKLFKVSVYGATRYKKQDVIHSLQLASAFFLGGET